MIQFFSDTKNIIIEFLHTLKLFSIEKIVVNALSDKKFGVRFKRVLNELNQGPYS